MLWSRAVWLRLQEFHSRESDNALLHAADGRVIVNREMRSVIHFLLAAAEGTFPAPHHGVLQDRQLIRLVVGVVQRTLNEVRIDLDLQQALRVYGSRLPSDRASCRAPETGSG